jgi:hypothetical protein
MDTNAQESFTKPEWIARELSLWPQIQERIQAGELEELLSARRKKRFLFPRWQWVMAAGSALLILLGISFVLNKGFFRRSTKAEVSLAMKNPQVNIIYAEIHGKKAKPFIFQTQENLFIWFDELNQEDD